MFSWRRESRRKKPGQEQAKVFSRNQPPTYPIGSLWAGEVVTGENTPEHKGEALRVFLGRLGAVVRATLANHKCRKWVQKLAQKALEK